ncbi:MAG: glycoside-pentoside-hexuronide (GPH):cation symporter [Paenibacillus macerans]|uniref:MFS transporter n=1 Tax=Paenibacillus macerans TaxID=44252 RepID=A0A090ZNM1_PAEMA|nr:glycoside-pentoside-hexuronide (GPH):cation symporter [Paenibacillus macerans]KFN12197.1 sugar (Glycoside-Pentoside-Hexuronide) transporter domain protein [Paenibacillus macerans]MBS5911818.1 glycoside-pentoside-hexuronide (GPH):cation symporter [Paenibacillus macerans]MCY7558412.1 glycoside-pentoside-hexuronide (GPH):cation symporter [Paenibacillus macerans]MDU5946082.1 glycoside-pentoside-hexuronide (GPH):cation symporter [Paenibacillus macerans]MDU7472222.1 glycoside-pentoside-hexuronide
MNPEKNLETLQIEQTGTQTRKFGFRDKFGYMLGDLGNDFFFMLVGSYLLVYYTDILGISPVAVGVLFMIARLWDALADITWGRFIDTRNPGKQGKFRPWIFRMSFPLVICGVLMFVHIPGLSDGFYVAYAYVTYILWGTLYSTVNIPYGSMASVITGNPVERTTLSTFRTLGATIAQLFVNAVVPLIIFVDNKIDANRILLAAVLFAILSLASYLGCFRLSTERITSYNSNNKVKSSMSTTLKGLLKNKPLISILAASLIFIVFLTLMGSTNVYLFKDYFSSSTALSLVGVMQVATVLIAMPLAKPLVAKFGKKEITCVGLLLTVMAYGILYFLPDLSANQFVALSAIGMFGYAFFNLMIWAFVTDIIDYHESLTGLREDGTIYSVYSFSRKVGQAVAGGVGGFAIGLVGYNVKLEVQEQRTLDGIYMLATLAPAIIILFAFLVIVLLYPLSKNRTLQLAEDLKKKRNG